MSQRGARILAGVFVFAFALLGIGQCGYKKIQTFQSLKNVEADIIRQFPSTDAMIPEGLALYQKTSQSVTLIDARSVEEYQVSRLEGALNLNEVEEILDFLESRSDSNDPVVIYGALGYRAAELAKEMNDRGVSNISHLRGGIFRWVNEGREVVDGDGYVTVWVHPYNKLWGRLLDKKHRFTLKESK